MRRPATLMFALVAACSASRPARLASDTVFGVHIGMTRRELETSFAPRGPGKWYVLESVAGETRLRWASSGDGAPEAVDVAIEGRVRELVFSLRPQDARAVLSAMGATPPSGLARFEGPDGEVVVAPGLSAWTIRLVARAGAGN